MSRAAELIGSRLREKNGWEFYDDSVTDLVEKVGEWIEDFVNSPKSPYLTIIGETGCGKTTLADAAVHVFNWNYSRVVEGDPPMPRSRSCGRVYGPDQASVEWSGYPGDKAAAARARHDPYFLHYDDFGRDHNRMDVVEGMFLRMLEKRSRKKTIITTNLEVEEIEKNFDKRILSRLIRNGSRIIRTSLKDYAIKE